MPHIIFGIVLFVALHLFGMLVLEIDPLNLKPKPEKPWPRWTVTKSPRQDHPMIQPSFFASYGDEEGGFYGCSDRNVVQRVVNVLNRRRMPGDFMDCIRGDGRMLMYDWVSDIGWGEIPEDTPPPIVIVP